MKNLFQNNRVFALFALYAVVLSTLAFASGCPGKDKVRAAIDASYRLPAATNDLIEKIRVARDTGVISVEQSQSFGSILNDVARAEVVFVGMVKTVHRATETEKRKPTPAELAGLRSFFDASIVEPFLRALELARVLTGPDVQIILLAITAARLLIRKIAAGIGSANVNRLSRASDSRIAIDTAGIHNLNREFT